MNRTAAPGRDPVAEVFEAIAQVRRATPGGLGGECTVTVRSRTGQLMARFTLDGHEQVFSFAELVRPLGYRMQRNQEQGGCRYDFSVDRRAANEAQDHPNRRSGD
jgi:hypothetical protein